MSQQTQKERLLHDLKMQESYLSKNAEAFQEIYGSTETAHDLAQGAIQTKHWIKQLQQDLNQ